MLKTGCAQFVGPSQPGKPEKQQSHGSLAVLPLVAGDAESVLCPQCCFDFMQHMEECICRYMFTYIRTYMYIYVHSYVYILRMRVHRMLDVRWAKC